MINRFNVYPDSDGNGKVWDEVDKAYITLRIDEEMASVIANALNEKFPKYEDGVYFLKEESFNYVLFIKDGVVYNEDGYDDDRYTDEEKGSATRIADLPDGWEVKE